MQEYTRTERVFSLFTSLRPGEGRGALRLGLQSFVIMFDYYLLKVIREPMILADGSAELKAYSTALQAVLLMLIVPAFARLYQRLESRSDKHHLFCSTLLFFSANLVILAIAVDAGLPVAITFYVWLGIFSVMILSLFWSFAADLYNLKSGQRLFPLIASAAALGALAGSALAENLSRELGASGVMWLAALLLLIPWWLGRRTEHTIPSGSSALASNSKVDRPYPLLEGFRIVLRSRYLRLIAAMVIVLNLINTNGEYILATLVTDQAHSLFGTEAYEQSITVFYARYFFVTTLLTFLVQLLLVARIYDRLGIAGALQVLPLIMIASYSLLIFLPLLVYARWVMVAENSVNYSLQFTTRNALYLPVRREQKYVGKHAIETFFFRLGDVLSGAFVYLGSVLLGIQLLGFIVTNALLAGLLLVLARVIGRQHDQCAAGVLANMPPMVMRQMDDMYCPAGRESFLQLDPQTFVDPDVGDALRYQAFTADRAKLPDWIRFDGLSRSFTIWPPQNQRGSLAVLVVARDFDGLEAEVNFQVHYGA